jgi:hypothetical protein
MSSQIAPDDRDERKQNPPAGLIALVEAFDVDHDRRKSTSKEKIAVTSPIPCCGSWPLAASIIEAMMLSMNTGRMSQSHHCFRFTRPSAER